MAHVIMKGVGKLHILTDSKYVALTIGKIQQSKQPKGRHQDLWTKVWENRHRLEKVTWATTHLTKEEAVNRGIPPLHWDLNRRADLQAGQGVCSHTEDLGAWAGWGRHILQIR